MYILDRFLSPWMVLSEILDTELTWEDFNESALMVPFTFPVWRDHNKNNKKWKVKERWNIRHEVPVENEKIFKMKIEKNILKNIPKKTGEKVGTFILVKSVYLLQAHQHLLHLRPFVSSSPCFDLYFYLKSDISLRTWQVRYQQHCHSNLEKKEKRWMIKKMLHHNE